MHKYIYGVVMGIASLNAGTLKIIPYQNTLEKLAPIGIEDNTMPSYFGETMSEEINDAVNNYQDQCEMQSLDFCIQHFMNTARKQIHYFKDNEHEHKKELVIENTAFLIKGLYAQACKVFQNQEETDDIWKNLALNFSYSLFRSLSCDEKKLMRNMVTFISDEKETIIKCSQEEMPELSSYEKERLGKIQELITISLKERFDFVFPNDNDTVESPAKKRKAS